MSEQTIQKKPVTVKKVLLILLAVLAAVDFVREHLGVEMERSVPVCTYSARNGQCIGRRCPFSAAT